MPVLYYFVLSLDILHISVVSIKWPNNFVACLFYMTYATFVHFLLVSPDIFYLSAVPVK